MKNLKVVENFYSIQGEGKYVGVPSVFLRLFGCNFRCPNFGRHGNDRLDASVTHNPEVNEVIKNLKNFESVNDLPLVKTGCDSYPASYAEFKNLFPFKSIDEIANDIKQLLPNGKWGHSHLVITGGEPLLWQSGIQNLLNHDFMDGLLEVTFETNGTIPLTEEFGCFLRDWSNIGERFYNIAGAVTFSVSPKLSCSGEPREKAINPSIITDYQHHGDVYLKIVVATQEDVNEAIDVVKIYRKEGFSGNVYLMPVGGTLDTYTLNEKTVAEIALENGLRYSPRLHISLWGNKWAT